MTTSDIVYINSLFAVCTTSLRVYIKLSVTTCIYKYTIYINLEITYDKFSDKKEMFWDLFLKRNNLKVRLSIALTNLWTKSCLTIHIKPLLLNFCAVISAAYFVGFYCLYYFMRNFCNFIGLEQWFSA